MSPCSDYLKSGSKGLKQQMRCMTGSDWLLLCSVGLSGLIEFVIKTTKQINKVLLIYHSLVIVM